MSSVNCYREAAAAAAAAAAADQLVPSTMQGNRKGPEFVDRARMDDIHVTLNC
jgi:hypothetical protein